MPNKNTFEIKPIKDLLEHYISPFDEVVDPFANNSDCGTIYKRSRHAVQNGLPHGCDRLSKMLPLQCADVVLYDPPFSPRQISECYTKLGMSVDMETTQASYWSKQKEQIARIIKPNGIVITCSWNSGGIGKKHGFEIEEILMVAHGGWHNDTIVTVERKVK